MIYSYKGTIYPTLDIIVTNETLVQSLETDPKPVLEYWYYFYTNVPYNPIILWMLRDSETLVIEPGNNRYVGRALRNSGEPTQAVLHTSDPIEESSAFELIDTSHNFNIPETSYEILNVEYPSDLYQYCVSRHLREKTIRNVTGATTSSITLKKLSEIWDERVRQYAAQCPNTNLVLPSGDIRHFGSAKGTATEIIIDADNVATNLASLFAKGI